MSGSLTHPAPGARASGPGPVLDDDPAWYEGLTFSGPLDPSGTLFAFLLALVATVGVVVVMAALVRIATAG